jgi:large subunit ribosomal protein L35
MKSRSAVTKRFKKTGSGKVKRGNSKTSHMFIRKTQKQKRKLRKSSLVSKAETKKIISMM